MSRLSDSRSVLGALIAISAIAVGCGSAAQRGGGALPSESGLDSLVREVRRVHADYEPSRTPAELARRADIVVSGRVAEVRPGQQYAPVAGARPVISTSVLVIDVDDVLAGDESLAQDGRVYVEVPHPAFVGVPGEGEPDTSEEIVDEVPYDTSAFAQTVPRTTGVFFLDNRTEESDSAIVSDEGAGRPEGAPITGYYAQGFWLSDDSGRLQSIAEPIEDMPAEWANINTLDQMLSAIADVSR